MERRPTTTPEQRIYDDFVPSHDLVRAKEAETIVIRLPGFKREHIKILIDVYGKLRISGERPVIDSRWSRFVKEFQVPDHCNASEIKATFEDGHLYIILPTFITNDGTKDTTKAPETTLDRRATTESKVDGSENETNQKTKSRPEESNGRSSKESVKKKESFDASKDVQKVEGKERDQIEEPKYTEKITSDGEHQEEGNGTQMTETMETTEQASGHGNMLGNVKNVGRLRSGLYTRRQLMLNSALAFVVLVGVGLYVTYKLKKFMQIDSYETEFGSSIPI